MNNKDWKTGLSYKLSLGVVILTIAISLIDLLYPPIFLKETTSAKAQVIGQDLVNLILGVPALLYSMSYARRGSIKARLIWLGVLAYYAYTYLSYGVLFKLNPGFILYTAAFAFSLYATLLNLAGLNIDKLEIESNETTRQRTQYVLGLIIVIIALLWTPDLATYYLQGGTPAAITSEGFHTLIIPFQDYSILLPLTILTIWLLQKQETTGYILAPVILVKAFSIAVAVAGMIIFIQIAGTPANLYQIIIFLLGGTLIGLYLRNYLKNLHITIKTTNPET